MREPSHAGGIVYRSGVAGPWFLLVQSRGNVDHWVLPKGHIDPGETPEEAAVREVAEEAGVDGEIVALVGDSDIVQPRGPARVRFFLMRERGAVPAIEDRETTWLLLADASARLTFDDQRRLLARARELVDAASR